MAKGEVKAIEYNPGEAPIESLPAEDGNYELALKDKGKPGPKGWKKSNPKKFPNRMCQFKLLGTEDEVTGDEKTVREFISLSPGFSLQKVAFLAYAAGYPHKLKLLSGPKNKPNDPSVTKNMMAIDKLLQWIEDNEVVLRAQIGTDTYNGRESNKIQKYLPPENGDSGASDSDEEDADTEDAETDETEAEDGEETEAEETEEAAEDEETEEAEEEAEEAEDSDDGEEAADEGEAEETEEEPEEEPEEKPAKKGKIHPGKKVKQGPLSKGKKKSKK
jgi:type IV secretory pathway VirB10-like protein